MAVSTNSPQSSLLQIFFVGLFGRQIFLKAFKYILQQENIQGFVSYVYRARSHLVFGSAMPL